MDTLCTLARKEFDQALRWRGLWLLTLVATYLAYAGWGQSSGLTEPRSLIVTVLGPDLTLASLHVPIVMLFSLAALMLSYRSVVGARASGSFKLTAVQPHSRAEILLATVFGRTAAVWTAAGVSVTFAIGVGILRYGFPDAVSLVLTLSATGLYLFTIVCFGTAISAAVERRGTAGTIVTGYYLGMNSLWLTVTHPALYAQLTGVNVLYSEPPQSVPLFFSRRVVPRGAYDVLLNTAIGTGNATGYVESVLVDSEAMGADIAHIHLVQLVFDGSLPLVLEPLFSVAILLLWALIPLSIAYIRFSRKDLVR
ncbi:ABC transporter permease [Haloarchaeobius iranensis]|uniref:ABC-type transport system involved in multi-copper enzyme maturation, permease component n=1 Tax=Haloarchaeobius iranensis TaxID=996166 RepID=A0A1G9Z973_9EURY|nr:ABC-type transport system involved in multi-copper enzyme maturation, permease component [Haloarchaeobius iranensis]